MSAVLAVNNLTVTYNNVPVLWNISINVPSGILLAIVGPNGAGKTTLIKAVLGLIKPFAGTIIFNKEYEKSIAYVPQRMSVDWDFPVSVFDVVLMGRYGHLSWFVRPSKNDKQKALHALEQVGMLAYASSHIGQLSGGQQQRVFLARALAQEAHFYIMDEPFAAVDITTEEIMITLLKQLRHEGKTIIMVHHDVHTLAHYFDWVCLLNKRCIAYGPVADVFVPEYVCAAYGNRTIFVQNSRQ